MCVHRVNSLGLEQCLCVFLSVFHVLSLTSGIWAGRVGRIWTVISLLQLTCPPTQEHVWPASVHVTLLHTEHHSTYILHTWTQNAIIHIHYSSKAWTVIFIFVFRASWDFSLHNYHGQKNDNNDILWYLQKS